MSRVLLVKGGGDGAGAASAAAHAMCDSNSRCTSTIATAVDTRVDEGLGQVDLSSEAHCSSLPDRRLSAIEEEDSNYNSNNNNNSLLLLEAAFDWCGHVLHQAFHYFSR